MSDDEIPAAWSSDAECRACLNQAAALLQLRGSAAFIAQAQQQAALHLLQARRLGAQECELEQLLLRCIRLSIAKLHALAASSPGFFSPKMPSSDDDLHVRVSGFLQAESDDRLMPVKDA